MKYLKALLWTVSAVGLLILFAVYPLIPLFLIMLFILGGLYIAILRDIEIQDEAKGDE